MKLLYKCDQPIPNNVIEALRFTGKVGFLSTTLWKEYFGQGNDRWKRRQLQLLVDRGYLQRHRNTYATRIYVLTDKSIEILKSLKASYVKPVPVLYLSHDIVVARSLLELKRDKIIGQYLVERTLKTYGIKEFLLSEKDNDQKYPDAVFKMIAYGKQRTAAIEYERERKSLSRYKSILWQYAGVTNISMVLFICENDGIRKAIESAKKYLGQTSLLDRLAFVSADDWQRSPANAPICLASREITLREICSPINELRADTG